MGWLPFNLSASHVAPILCLRKMRSSREPVAVQPRPGLQRHCKKLQWEKFISFPQNTSWVCFAFYKVFLASPVNQYWILDWDMCSLVTGPTNKHNFYNYSFCSVPLIKALQIEIAFSPSDQAQIRGAVLAKVIHSDQRGREATAVNVDWLTTASRLLGMDWPPYKNISLPPYASEITFPHRHCRFGWV